MTARVWLGCASALCGSVLMSLSHSGSDLGAAAAGVATGDALLVGAALLWSVQASYLSPYKPVQYCVPFCQTFCLLVLGDALLVRAGLPWSVQVSHNSTLAMQATW